MIKKGILAALLIGGLLAVGLRQPPLRTRRRTWPPAPSSTSPRGTAAERGATLSRLGRLVNGAQSGSDIRISLHLFGSSWLADQLVAAHHRNVNVTVLIDDDSITAAWTSGSGAAVRDKLSAALSAIPPAGETYGKSWFKVCAANQPCLAKGTGGVNHNKFLLFSQTTGSGLPDKGKPVDSVVVQSSGNLTTWDRESAWNDAMTVAGNAELHAGYTRYFDRMAASQALPDGSGRVDNLAIDVEAGPAKGPVTLLAHAAPKWGDAVQAGFTPAQWLLVLAFAEWSRLRR
ncbi:phospholipase D-like domain-containing protein [Streptomyces sp. NPDC058746]|uniref:phospholipase D-like domain-containing protein n=2 Tax=unclassified Streptomyces TaxID=2593676 RepID=UPI0036AA6538